MLTRKHYKALADIIAQAAPVGGMVIQWQVGCNAGREYIAEALCAYLKGDNPRFDRGRFLEACDLEHL